MSKKDGSEMLVHQLSSVLPDDRPITAIRIIEDIDKCPPNFTVVSRTYDLDADADLWRESGLFIKKKSRYICFSKSEVIIPHTVIDKITIVDERDTPPEGFSMISHTVDSQQKAWRKRQLCFNIKHKDSCTIAVSDIIVCSRVSKSAPVEFVFAGSINGVYIYYKTVPISNGATSTHPYANIELFRELSPRLSNGTPHRIAPERPPKLKYAPKPPNGIYPQISPNAGGKFGSNQSLDRDYEMLNPNAKILPTRPAPRPPKEVPVANTALSYGTLSGTSYFDGVPFVLNSLLNFGSATSNPELPVIKVRTLKELDKEYFYDFRAERET